MSTRQVLGGIGAAIGFYFGGAQGAQWGWMIGSAIGGVVDPEIIKGPSIGDIANQTSQEGVPRPIVFALSQPMGGNIIASGAPRIVRKRETQGKGGPKVETETVYRTYAIGVCEGPITRFVRIWRNGTVVYDANDPFMTGGIELDFLGETLVLPGQNSKFLQTGRLFLGLWDQLPSPDLEAAIGVGITPAHRGTAYLVMANEDLTDLRGAIPQYVFQVERCEGFYLTSRPYPIEDTAAFDADLSSLGGYQLSPGPEGLEMTFTGLGGSVYGSVEDYENGDPEGFDMEFEALGGSIYGGLVVYDDGAPEGFDMTFEGLGGSLYGGVIEYGEYPPEGFDMTFEALGGTLGV